VDRWAGEGEFLDRGRSWSRSPSRSARGRELLQHASEDWERRRSRSPVRHSARHIMSMPVSPDPMLHVYREPVAAGGSRTWEEDPMVHEFLFHCAASQPCFSPDNSGEAIDSPMLYL
jgi:hypothetical protein